MSALPRAVALVGGVAVAACTSDVERVATSYAQAEYCPDVRIHATALPELVLWNPPPVPAPYPEPALPADVASDPARLALWRADRDAGYREWMRSQPSRPTPRALSLYAVDGCGAPRLYACRNGRRGHRLCDRIDDAIGRGMYLACRDGTAVRFHGSAFSCSGVAATDAQADRCERTSLGALRLCKLLAHE